jgi:uncharacterized membrane protein
MSKESNRPSVWNRIRTNFLTGLLVLAPLVITAYVVWKLFIFVDHLLGTTLRGGYIRPGGVPGLGFLTVLVIIFMVGLLANNFLGRQVGNLLESMLMRLPVFRSFYSTVKQMGEALLGDKKGSFQRVVLVEFPSSGRYALGFVTSSVSEVLPEPGGKPIVGVFVPSVPNPTTGHLLFFPEEDLIPTNLKVEQAIRMIVSGGVVTPGGSA